MKKDIDKSALLGMVRYIDKFYRCPIDVPLFRGTCAHGFATFFNRIDK